MRERIINTIIIIVIAVLCIGGTAYYFNNKDNSKKSEDNIKSIFSTYELIEVKETDKVGIAQIQESIN